MGEQEEEASNGYDLQVLTHNKQMDFQLTFHHIESFIESN